MKKGDSNEKGKKNKRNNINCISYNNNSNVNISRGNNRNIVWRKWNIDTEQLMQKNKPKQHKKKK